MSTLLKLAASLFALSLTAGCQAWPPESAFLTRHFKNNRQSFEALERKIDATTYYDVSERQIVGTDEHGEPPQVFAREWSGEELSDYIEITGDPEWNELLTDTGVFTVSQHEPGYSFSLSGVGWLEDDQFYYVRYYHGSEYRDRLAACQPEYQELSCGLCAVDLPEQAWFLVYEWWPDPLLSLSADGNYAQELFDADSECRVEGYREIGYEPSEWITN